MSNFTDFIGGGGGSEINDIKPINSTDLLYTDAEGNKWLRQGYLDTDTTTYPSPATVRKTIGEWDGTSYYSSNNIAEGITFDGTNYWMVVFGSSTSYLQKLNATTFAVAQTVTLSNSNLQNKTTGICWDSTNSELLIIGQANNNRIVRYNTNGTAIGTLFDCIFRSSTNSQLSSLNASGITTDGTYVYTSHNLNYNAKAWLAKWSMAGVLQERIELPSVGSNVLDLQLFDGNIWVMFENPEVMISIDATTHIWNGDSFAIGRYDYNPNTFCFHDTTCVIPTATSQPHYLKHPYITGVGLGRMEVPQSGGTQGYNSDGGKQINYTRIK